MSWVEPSSVEPITTEPPPTPVILPSGEVAHVITTGGDEPAEEVLVFSGDNEPCATCREPGVCCRSFSLPHWRFSLSATREDVRDAIRDGRHVDAVTGESKVFESLPFEPQRPASHYCRPGGHEPIARSWEFSCPWLDERGRCSHYENRPSLCRNFLPSHGTLCIEFPGPWKGWMRVARDPEKVNNPA